MIFLVMGIFGMRLLRFIVGDFGYRVKEVIFMFFLRKWIVFIIILVIVLSVLENLLLIFRICC